MTRQGRNEGCRVLDDFVCEAVPDPSLSIAVPASRGRNEGADVMAEIVFDASSARTTNGSRSQRAYNTNLASEFYVMSVLYRLGLDAYLTLGNKKAIDIVVARAPGDTITIDVKAVAGKDDWEASNAGDSPRDRHFVVLLAYDGKFPNVAELPKVWVFPHEEFLHLAKQAKAPSKRRFVGRSQVNRLENRRDAWGLLRAAPT